MTNPLNILTFNWHEPYICLLSRTGHNFVVVTPKTKNDTVREWDERMRPIPKNVIIVNPEAAEEGLKNNSYDLAICNNIQDVLFIQDFSLPFIKVFHNKFSTEAGLSNNPPNLEEYKQKMKEVSSKGLRVFISESKKANWGFEGDVITPGIDVADYPEYLGDVEQAFVVGNLVKERDLMMGYSDQVELLDGIPNFLMGLNPTIPTSRLSDGWDDLKDHFKRQRFYLNTTVNEHEDGYNLAMLEAMATGMPIISTYNSTSPIIDGENGFISQDKEYLKKKIKELLQNPELAKEIGAKGRQTILEKFNINNFAEKWNQAIQKALDRAKQRHSVSDQKQYKIKNILFNYTYYPATTAFYLDRAFKKHFNVVTSGATIGTNVVKAWKLENMKKELRPQDIPTPYISSATMIMDSLPEGFQPDIFIWCETGVWCDEKIGDFPIEMEKLTIPAACYFVDTHIHLERHLKTAKSFDFVFLAQKEYVPKFIEQGIRCYWLPLGCDPEIHGKKSTEKKYDVGFVGSVTDPNSRRANLIEKISKRSPVHIERCFHEEMATLFSESKMVFNNCVNEDLNMRIFEAMCSGTLLLTDAPKNSGFDEMFQDGKHLAVYEDDKIADVVAYYLEHEEERERIARAGEQEVLAKHTYERRALEMIDVIEKEINSMASGNSEKDPEDSLLEVFTNLKESKDYEAIIAEYETSANNITGDKKEKVDFISAEAYAMTGKFGNAKSIYQECLNNNPNSCEALIGLGTLAIQEQNADKAYSAFQKAIELDETSSKALCGNGITLIMQGFIPESKEYFTKALDSDIENSIALNQLVTVCHVTHDYTDAIRYLERYITLHQTALDYCYTLATLYLVSGDKKKAHNEVQKVLLFDPENNNALELLAKIESGE